MWELKMMNRLKCIQNKLPAVKLFMKFDIKLVILAEYLNMK
jgi:hypothetical protein